MKKIGNTFYGTASEFVEAGVKLNGNSLSQADVSTLGRLNVIKAFGKGNKPARGQTPTVFRADVQEGMQFTVAAFAKVQELDSEDAVRATYNPNPVVKSKALETLVQALAADNKEPAAASDVQESNVLSQTGAESVDADAPF